ncbi:hypothetical protein KAU39_05645 [bacterium]|nr:hypothetical protein [bacterium]
MVKLTPKISGKEYKFEITEALVKTTKRRFSKVKIGGVPHITTIFILKK